LHDIVNGERRLPYNFFIVDKDFDGATGKAATRVL
jgi:hypothetical protein